MSDAQLVRELQRLRRGHGVRRPKPETWIGPELRGLLDSAYGPADGEQLRENLIDLLRQASEVLTGVHKPLFQAALGAAELDGLLTDRLGHMAAHLDRDQRTLQRWLLGCDQLVAERLEQDEQMRQAEAQVMRRGWTLERFEGFIHFDRPQPEYLTRRTIHVLSPTLDAITDLFSLPEEVDRCAAIEVEAVSGCRLNHVERPSHSLWQMHLDLPRVLRRGERWELATRVRLASRELSPSHSVMAPARPCEAFDLQVYVGDSGAHDFRALEAIPLVVLTESASTGTPVTPVDGVVPFSARNLTPGLAYGLRWRWPG